MKTVVAFQFEMQPHHGQTSLECLAAVRDTMTDWVRGLFRGFGVHDLQLTFDGSRAAPREGHEVRAEEWGSAPHWLTALEWEFRQPDSPATVWQFSGTAACDARTVQVALVIRKAWRSFALRPLDPDLSNANPLCTVAQLRDKLMLGWKCRVESEPIPSRARLVRKNHTDRFVREVLRNPNRVFPVVLLVLNGGLKIDLDSLHALQAQLMGLADVAAVMDQPAAQRLAKLVGPQVFPPDMALRVYWPKLLEEGWPQSHPYQTLEQLQKNLPTASLPSLTTLCLTLLAPVSAEQFQEGRLIREARAAVAGNRSAAGPPDLALAERLAAAEADLQQARQGQQHLQREYEAAQRRVLVLLDELADLRTQLVEARAAVPPAPRPPDEQFDELAAELERAWDENKRLQTDWEAARRQLAELETDFRNYLDSSVLFWEPRGAADPSAASLPAASGRRFATVAEALRAAAADFADVLVVWEDAERSAEESLFASPAKVFQALQAVAEVGRAYFQARDGGPPLGPVERAFLSRVPFKYTTFESQTTLSMFGAERTFQHRGQSRQMQRHLTLGGGTTNNCLQIYFDFDLPSRRVLIGHCGRHLPYSRQRT